MPDPLREPEGDPGGSGRPTPFGKCDMPDRSSLPTTAAGEHCTSGPHPEGEQAPAPHFRAGRAELLASCGASRRARTAIVQRKGRPWC
eukprot:5469189-Alexandrium_andersonii.AAC.1